MSEANLTGIGSVAWADLTVPNAVEVRDFYAAVTGWQPQPVDMGGYEDFCMNRPGDGTTVAGVCHARGDNAGLPPQWLIYVTVASIEASAHRTVELGGVVVVGMREMGGGRMCVIRDPAGAVLALFQSGE